MGDNGLLLVENVHARYGNAEVLQKIIVNVDEGEVVSLIGANGAGKTTILKVISGLIRPVHGNVIFDGSMITGMQAFEIRRMGLVHVPEGRGILKNLTVQENLMMGAYGEKRKEQNRRIEATYDQFRLLRERSRQSGGSLSGGEQQILAIARGLMAQPRCLMLDEPSLGLAPLMVDWVFGILKDLKATGLTILLVEQNAMQALEISNRAYIIEVGQIVHEGSIDKITSEKHIVEAYLGM